MSSNQQTLIAYADCFSGVSGDMFLGALVDAGLPLDYLQTQLAALHLEEFTIRCTRQQDHTISSTGLTIKTEDSKITRTWKDIRTLIENSALKTTVKEKALTVFTCLADAEAKIHDCQVEDVHFHEIGGLDSIIDIAGTVIGLDYLGIARLITSPLPMPRGFIRCDHGMLPLPAPAVCEILQDVPVYGSSIEQELVTPTGAALVKSLSSDFGDFPAMKISRTGYGAGSRKLSGDLPNLFRLVIGYERKVEEIQEVEVIETNLDDWSPESYPHLCEQLFSSGALDVSLIPVHMKKGRPGFLLSVITSPAFSGEIKKCIFAETTSLGLRFGREKRMTLPRETGTVNTSWGPVQAKRVETPTGYALYPEYEDCRRVALENKVPLKDVYAEVNRCSLEEFKKD
ncbi:MAG: nickel pincer cofactor biosynthesis protein LarC [Desulfobacterales bacterium]|nr:nickel pincer cofactor biosynthesis protein LarC [Desulfobacterales bacterium]